LNFNLGGLGAKRSSEFVKVSPRRLLNRIRREVLAFLQVHEHCRSSITHRRQPFGDPLCKLSLQPFQSDQQRRDPRRCQLQAAERVVEIA
jgi:hypothetical protein